MVVRSRRSSRTQQSTPLFLGKTGAAPTQDHFPPTSLAIPSDSLASFELQKLSHGEQEQGRRNNPVSVSVFLFLMGQVATRPI
jgi:hypothetical protein